MKTYQATAIIVFWIIVVVSSIAIGSRSLLTSGVQDSTNLTNPNTESGMGQNLLKERFNITSDTVTHIIVLDLPNGSDFSLPSWQNFTLYLTLELNETFSPLNYTVLSEPLLKMNPLTTDLASSLISKDKTSTLIYLRANKADVPNYRKEDVTTLRDMLGHPEDVYTYAEKYLQKAGVDAFFPAKADLTDLKLMAPTTSL